LSLAIGRYVRQKRETDAAAVTTVSALGFVGKFLLWSFAALLALENLGVNVTALVAGLGIGGIAVALAAQNVLGDLLASLSIVLDKPFVLGDFIIVDDRAGSVEQIGLKTTRLRSLSGEQLIFSNNDLLKSRIRNFKRMQERRVAFTVGAAYDTPRDKLRRIPAILREAIEAQPETRFDRAHFKELGSYALNFEVVYYVLKPEYNLSMDIQQSVNLTVLERFAAEEIELAFPTQTVYVRGANGGSRIANGE
jgi:small-conductance mechanosensitive channel